MSGALVLVERDFAPMSRLFREPQYTRFLGSMYSISFDIV
ncbi:hypothetical protein GGQ76_000274 [Aureimonas jatrophae]|uniref:Uncharacterized protein n=1 Tax=Aureimonas jatrophae TaxID=1166073 RepID=A0A1H0BZM5_9HYPH|nr:hypothetical protein [Aureimonas jatrophae]SDN51158.1 hypothetical protein SAMN05192530_10175 [Aureimonas jatrophae]